MTGTDADPYEQPSEGMTLPTTDGGLKKAVITDEDKSAEDLGQAARGASRSTTDDAATATAGTGQLVSDDVTQEPEPFFGSESSAAAAYAALVSQARAGDRIAGLIKQLMDREDAEKKTLATEKRKLLLKCEADTTELELRAERISELRIELAQEKALRGRAEDQAKTREKELRMEGRRSTVAAGIGAFFIPLGISNLKDLPTPGLAMLIFGTISVIASFSPKVMKAIFKDDNQ